MAISCDIHCKPNLQVPRYQQVWLRLAMRPEPVSQVNNPPITHLSKHCMEHEAGKQASKHASSKQAKKQGSKQASKPASKQASKQAGKAVSRQ